jgi:peptide deformylase
MAQLEILEYPDPRLRRPAAPVIEFDSGLARLASDLLDTLYANAGIGLSAPQAGNLRQVLVMDLSESASDPQVFVNPEIIARAAPGLVEESCLSVPGVTGNVLRATRVRVRAADTAGLPFERDLEGMAAVCLQHEMDHLAGKLFIDRLSLFRRLRLRAAENRTRRRQTGTAAEASG